MPRPLFLLLTTLFTLAAAAQSPELPAPNSGAGAAQPEFRLGLFQLHNFEYADAAKHFRAAEALDPTFALAFWGEAMTFNHAVWHEQDLDAARAALNRLAPTPAARLAKAPTPREQLYLQAAEILFGPGEKSGRDLAFESAMASLHHAFPADIDATAFYALAILGSAQNGRDFAIYMRAAAILEEVFPQHLTHPGVLHYLIHCYDDPIHAPLGLRAARLYAAVAPDAGHAQHMTSHIFLALGMWPETSAANETAAAVANRPRRAAGRPDVACFHVTSWLDYSYLQQNRIDDARRILTACRQEADRLAPRAAGMPPAVDSDISPLGTYASMRTSFLLNSQLWTDPVASETIFTTPDPFVRFTFHFGSAFAALRAHLPSAPAAVAQVEADAALAKPLLEDPRSGDPHSRDQERIRESILLGQLHALQLFETTPGEAIAQLRVLATQEQSLPLEFGPPFIDKPTNELLGELLLAHGRPEEAHAAFTTALTLAPNRRLCTNPSIAR